MKKINLAELLKDCPKNMRLYSPIFGDVYLEEIKPHLTVAVRTFDTQKEEFLYDGRFGINGECMLFPSKENRDWSKFNRPFKNGDIISNGDYIAIFYKLGIPCDYTSSNIVYYHCYYSPKFLYLKKESDFGIGISTEFKYATKEEKEKLFKAIKNNGYKWNEKTKTLEELVQPIFKKGDKVKVKNRFSEHRIIKDVCDTFYTLVPIGKIDFTDQDNWELVSNKFDITILKEFESRVLVRDYDDQIWIPTFWGKYLGNDSNCSYLTTNGCYKYCIPYEGNEHLLGTTNNCNNFYKTW